MENLPINMLLDELQRTQQRQQERLQAQQFEIQTLKADYKQLRVEHDQLKVELNSSSDERMWLDKRAFVSVLSEAGLMIAARSQSVGESADDMRYLNRLMRDFDIFSIYEGATEPPASKQVWKLSPKKLLFHRTRAVERFRCFTRRRSQFTRTDQD